MSAGLILGLSLSVASTVVLLRMPTESHMVPVDEGRIAIGWLVVQDLVMVMAPMMIPPLARLLGGVEAPLEPAAATEVARLGVDPVWATLMTTAAKVAAFVVLMLFNPAVLWTEPWSLLATILIILGLKSAAARAILRSFGHAMPTSLFLAAGLAQIGAFSFILIGMSVDLAIFPATARDLVVAGALLSILANPLLIFGAKHLATRLQAKPT